MQFQRGFHFEGAQQYLFPPHFKGKAENGTSAAAAETGAKFNWKKIITKVQFDHLIFLLLLFDVKFFRDDSRDDFRDVF